MHPSIDLLVFWIFLKNLRKKAENAVTMTRSTPRNQPNNKRKPSSNNSWNNSNRRTNPRRGGPGILITCETGRDSKAKREGLDILEHYWNLQNNTDDSKKEVDKTLSLDDEIAMLKTRKKKGDSFLTEYDTGCRGTVSFICILPACALVAPMEKETTRQIDQEHNNGVSNKKPKLEIEPESKDNTQEEASLKQKVDTVSRLYDPFKPTPWDPLAVVHNIITDIQSNNKEAPSSRFISRMIPIQATCYSTMEEITHMATSLLDKYLSPNNDPKTFSVAIKQRNCSLVKKDQVIDSLYNLVVAKKKHYTVKLKNADVTILVEICKTLCGMSVIDNCAERFQNFNLQEFREKAGALATGDEQNQDQKKDKEDKEK